MRVEVEQGRKSCFEQSGSKKVPASVRLSFPFTLNAVEEIFSAFFWVVQDA
jgi:hypothetical protein